MQARPDQTRQEGGGTAIWCATCGIPYAPTMTHCSHCGAPLNADPVGLPALVNPASAAPRTDVGTSGDAPAPVEGGELTDDRPVPLSAELISPLPVEGAPLATRGLLDRVRQRQHVMSEDEVDAAAAAIIARARAEEQLLGASAAPRDALDLLPNLLPDPVVERALQQRRERDRIWLIVGVVCCVLLIIFALAISRYMSIGIARR